MREQWKIVEGYPNYRVSKTGRIQSNRIHSRNPDGEWRYLALIANRNGYLIVGLTDTKKKRKHFYVSRLVAKAFIPNPDNKLIVNHINWVITDNRVCNLNWMTYKENSNHKKYPETGEWNNNVKITEETARLIKKKLKEGIGTTALARELGITRDIVNNIKIHNRWSHVT